MRSPTRSDSFRFEQRYLIGIVLVVAVVVFVLTWVGIRESRADSFRLLVRQGTAFTVALAEAAENAIAAETFYDRLVQRRYSDLVATLVGTGQPDRLTNERLTDFAQTYELYGVYAYTLDSLHQIRQTSAGGRSGPPVFVEQEIRDLAAQPDLRFVQLLDQDEQTGDVVQYYLQMSDNLRYVYVIAADARAYDEALEETGIGFLSQRMAREEGVEYIIYQVTDGIVFASRKPGPLLAIESDPFLTSALAGDTTVSRIFAFQGQDVLELVHPFATEEYPQGLFRVGISLRGFYQVARSFDVQMIVIAAVLFGLVVAVTLYLNSRRKRRELSREYQQIKSLTDTIFERMQTGVAVVDATGSIRLANEAFERSLNVQGIVGRQWNAAITVPGLELDAMLSGPQSSGEREVSIPAGKELRSLLVAWSRVTFEDPDSSALVIVAYDITRMRQFEQEAARRERLSEMGNLAAGVAHEIRNPLNTISIAAQRLAGEFTPSENADEYLRFTQSIRGETKRLNDIITRFLALAKEMPGQRRNINLRRAVEDSLALITVEAQKLGIQVESSIEDSLTIDASPDAIREMLLNLYNNTKEALNGKPGRIAVTGELIENRIILTFADSGPGVPVELREKVFTPYFTTKEAGTGLGLPTVHRIAADLGGSVRVEESRLGGAAFIITIPLRD